MRSRQTLLAVVAGAVLGWTSVRARADEPDQSPQVIPPPANENYENNNEENNNYVVPPPTPPVYAEPPRPAPVYAEPVPPPPPAVPPRRQHRKHNKYFAPGEATLAVGGGVADFVGSSMRNATEFGAEWDARVTIGARSLFAFEAGYVGTYNKLQSPIEGAGSVAPWLANNGFDTDLRLNLLPWRVQPYLFGGVGYNHASMNNLADSPAMAARFRSSDDQLVLPAGAGVSFYPLRHATFDARFTYRAIFADNIDRTTDARLDQWIITGRCGYTF